MRRNVIVGIKQEHRFANFVRPENGNAGSFTEMGTLVMRHEMFSWLGFEKLKGLLVYFARGCMLQQKWKRFRVKKALLPDEQEEQPKEALS